MCKGGYTQWYGFSRVSVSWPQWRGTNMSGEGGYGPLEKMGRGTYFARMICWIFYGFTMRERGINMSSEGALTP